MNRKIIIILFLHIFSFVLTQTKPPESYSLIRGVNENINLNSGTVDLSIPVFEISDGNFTLKNTINYESRGFVPHISPSYVGLNWNMIQFGKITRESHRIDFTTTNTKLVFSPNSSSTGGDDINDIDTNPNNYFRNDHINVRYPIINGNPSYKKDIYNNPFGKDYYASLYVNNSTGGTFISGKSYSFDPDKYYFDFMGYKGYFIVDNEGSPIVYCENAKLKVNIENYGRHDIFGNITFSEFIITDDKGNEYFFGGNTDALDINFSFNRVFVRDNNYYVTTGNGFPVNFHAANKTNYIDSWLLKKIVLNTGETVTAYYKSQDINILNNFRGFNPTINIPADNSLRPYYENIGFPDSQTLKNNNLVINHVRQFFDSSTRPISAGTTSYNQGADRHHQIDTYTKRAVLDSITTNNSTIKYLYNYSTNPSELSNNYLNKIIIKHKAKIIKEVNFHYENFGTSEKRTFLTKITNTGNEDVSFEYYKTDIFPPYKNSYYLTNDLGYWNGMMNSTPDIDQYIFQGFPDDLSKYDVGLLKRVIYPTKGSTTYFYENANYSKVYKYNDLQNPQYLTLINENKTVNAPRIFRKSDNNENSIIETIYSYKNDDNSSSGIIDGTLNFIPSASAYGTFTRKNSSTNLMSQNSLHYSTVTTNIPGKGFIKYKFTDRITNPDIYNGKLTANPVNPGYCNITFNERDKILLSKHYERGKILKEQVYDNNGFQLKEKYYEYNNFLNKFPTLDNVNGCNNCKISDLNYYVKVANFSPLHKTCNLQTIYTPVLPYLPTKIKTKEYFGSNTIESSQDLLYNDSDKFWHPYPIKKTSDFNGKINITNIFYPADMIRLNGCFTSSCNFVNSINPGKKMLTYKQMTDDNIYLPILEINKNSFDKFSLNENVYNRVGNINKYRLNSKKKSNQNSNFNETSFENAEVYEEMKYDLYDNRENLLQYTTNSGIPTTVLWGYDQTLPIAKIEGATYAQIMQAFNLDPTNTDSYLQLPMVIKSDMDMNDSTESELLTELKVFKSKVELNNFQITTYSYDPLIGVKTINPPSGNLENYKYDTANRLESIKDIEGKILKEFKYNYAPTKYYNAERTGNFVKYCSGNEIGSNYTYTVAANTYSSIISQADADQKAQDDINANGQNAANINGTCTPFTCNLYFNSSIGISGGGSVGITQTSYYKVNFGFSSGSNSTNLPWMTTGVKVATINGTCLPTTEYSSYNGQVYYTIKTNGDIILRSQSTVPANNTSYNYEIIFPVN